MVEVGKPAGFTLRTIEPTDGSELTSLSLITPDSGRIPITPLYHVDAYRAFTSLHADVLGVVAESSGLASLIGAGFLTFGTLANDMPYGTLRGLMVHPDYRRQGLATKLATWRIEQARKRMGEDCLLLTTVQNGNVGSLKVAKGWGELLPVTMSAGVVAVRAKEPQLSEDWTVRPVLSEELPELVAKLDRFYRKHQFYVRHTVDSLSDWLAYTPFTAPLRHYYVLVDRQNNLLAGLAVEEQHRLIEMQVEKLPTALGWLNKLIKMVPADGRMRQLTVSRVWYSPGQQQAARALWESVRWQWREKATALTVGFDARDPLGDIFKIPFWLPKGKLNVVAHNATEFDAQQLIYPGF